MPKTEKNVTTLRFISDPGHGWLEVPVQLCKLLRLDPDYTRRGNLCYLEEDCEAADFDRAAKRQNLTVKMVDHEVDDFDTWLDGIIWPAIPKLG
jgi:hypothetical protein